MLDRLNWSTYRPGYKKLTRPGKIYNLEGEQHQARISGDVQEEGGEEEGHHTPHSSHLPAGQLRHAGTGWKLNRIFLMEF